MRIEFNLLCCISKGKLNYGGGVLAVYLLMYHGIGSAE
jgi:hypothetical protein